MLPQSVVSRHDTVLWRPACKGYANLKSPRSLRLRIKSWASAVPMRCWLENLLFCFSSARPEARQHPHGSCSTQAQLYPCPKTATLCIDSRSMFRSGRLFALLFQMRGRPCGASGGSAVDAVTSISSLPQRCRLRSLRACCRGSSLPALVFVGPRA